MKKILLEGFLSILCVLTVTLWLMKQSEKYNGYEARLR